MRRRRPSPLATALLRWSVRPDDRDAILGDLEEEYGELASTDPRRAAARYWSEALRSVAPLMAWRLRCSSRLRVIGGVLAGWIAAVASASVVGGGLESLLDADARTVPAVVGAVVVLCVLASSASAGWVSGRVAGQRSVLLLVAVGLVVVAPEVIHGLLVEHAHQSSLPLVLALVTAPLGLVAGATAGRNRQTTRWE